MYPARLHRKICGGNARPDIYDPSNNRISIYRLRCVGDEVLTRSSAAEAMPKAVAIIMEVLMKCIVFRKSVQYRGSWRVRFEGAEGGRRGISLLYILVTAQHVLHTKWTSCSTVYLFGKSSPNKISMASHFSPQQDLTGNASLISQQNRYWTETSK